MPSAFPPSPHAAVQAAPGRGKAEQLREFGAEAFVLSLSRAQAESGSVARLPDRATGIWLPGADQARLAPLPGAAGARLLLPPGASYDPATCQAALGDGR